MAFYADLHIHSKYSRATSRDADLEHMSLWARKKGVAVLGTGDFTHPQWFREIEEKLVPAEPGLFRLRPELERQVEAWLGGGESPPTRFLLEVEISTIYKKDDRTRKVHHLIYAPHLEAARELSRSLERIGNIASDGRPILGLDSRHLLEIALEAGEGCYLIPAHIWTPWFAVLGSKSGFDTIEDCYGDLSSEIFAVETGLSSDPSMNRRLSRLDRYTLVSNSDAHSPPRIGREACVFEGEMSYFSMRRALETGEGYGGTIEFFAEEGKYHLDGHRNCGVCLAPEESRRSNGDCPACGKPLTLGVMHRVAELADREEEAEPPTARPFQSLVPLDEVLSEIQRVGPKSKSVQRSYEELVSRLGSELFILESAPLEDVERASSSIVAEALSRMREGRVIRHAGYDGLYGSIRIFEDDELDRKAGMLLFDFMDSLTPPREKAAVGARRASRSVSRPASDRTRASLPASGDGGARHGNASSKRSDGVPPSTQPGESSGVPGQAPIASVAGPAENGTSTAERPQRATRPGGAADSRILGGLDRDQRSCAESTEGPCLVIAGPGTGKTRTLTHRLAHIISGRGAAPEECLAITFTRRAAAEMAARLRGLLPAAGKRVPVMTFHALGLGILQEHGSRLGLAEALRLVSESEASRWIMDALSVKERRARQLLAAISLRKRRAAVASLSPREAGAAPSARARPAREDLAFECYGQFVRQHGLLDFDDLIGLSVRLFAENPDLKFLLRQNSGRYMECI